MPPRVVGVNEPAGPDVSDFSCPKKETKQKVESVISHYTRDTMTA
jgi:hypothetical protein